VLCGALLDGPPRPLMVEESVAVARALVDGLALTDGRARFAALSALTLRHFAREQAIFTHHMGRAEVARREPALVRRFSSLRAVPAPAIERGLLGRRLVYRPHRLPDGFDLRDHDARVREFGAAFVSSVTGSLDDYRAAVAFVASRFGRAGERASAQFLDGEAPIALS
jgi:hypothetical protein